MGQSLFPGGGLCTASQFWTVKNFNDMGISHPVLVGPMA